MRLDPKTSAGRKGDIIQRSTHTSDAVVAITGLNVTPADWALGRRWGLSNKRCIWGCFRGQWEWADRRPLKVMSKALRALFQRWVHRALPLPVGSRAMTAM